MTENTLIDLPTGVVSFYMDQNMPRTPGKGYSKGTTTYCLPMKYSIYE